MSKCLIGLVVIDAPHSALNNAGDVVRNLWGAATGAEVDVEREVTAVITTCEPAQCDWICRFATGTWTVRN